MLAYTSQHDIWVVTSSSSTQAQSTENLDSNRAGVKHTSLETMVSTRICNSHWCSGVPACTAAVAATSEAAAVALLCLPCLQFTSELEKSKRPECFIASGSHNNCAILENAGNVVQSVNVLSKGSCSSGLHMPSACNQQIIPNRMQCDSPA